jgi:hypothetical protein
MPEHICAQKGLSGKKHISDFGVIEKKKVDDCLLEAGE